MVGSSASKFKVAPATVELDDQRSLLFDVEIKGLIHVLILDKELASVSVILGQENDILVVVDDIKTERLFILYPVNII